MAKQVFITWFMRDFGAAFMGNCATLTVFKKNKESQIKLKKNWGMAKNEIEIQCLYPDFYDQKENDKISKSTNHSKKEKYTLLKTEYPDFDSEDYWDICHVMPYDEQLKWFKKAWGKQFSLHRFSEFKEMDSLYSASMEDIISSVREYIRQYISADTSKQYYINIHNTPSETQIAWYILASELRFSSNIHFCRFRAVEKVDNGLGAVKLDLLSTNPLDDYYKRIFQKPQLATLDQDAIKKVEYWLCTRRNYFSILMLGERGSGKTHLVNEVLNTAKGNSDSTSEQKEETNAFELIEANCASFSDDNLAESAFFGYEKGAFTGANEKTPGLFHEANGKILFLDEIHHLSKRVQAKLLTALQTDDKGNFGFKRLGATTKELVKFQLICASNRPLDSLKTDLYRDFFDRISQRIVVIPSIHGSKNIEKAFRATWAHLRFDSVLLHHDNVRSVIDWLKERPHPLPGNYRDLQQIAISMYDYLADEDGDVFNHEDGLLNFIKQEYLKRNESHEADFSVMLYYSGKGYKNYLQNCKYQIAKHFIDRNKGKKTDAVKELKMDSRATLDNWLKIT